MSARSASLTRRACAIFAVLAMIFGSAAESKAQDSARAPFIGDAAAPPIGNLIDSLVYSTVGLRSLHRLRFTTPEAVPVDARFRVTFPTGFGLDSVKAFYADTTRPDTPRVDTSFVEGNSVWVFMDTTGTPATPGTVMRLRFSKVLNDTVAGTYQVALEIYSSSGTLLWGPTLTQPFSLTAAAPSGMILQPSGPVTVPSGQSRQFTATVRDRYNNRIDTASVTYRVEPPALGTMFGGLLLALAADTGRVYAHHGELTDVSVPLTVTPGPLARWDIAGTPAQATAGDSLGAGSIVVTARDAFGNRVKGYLGAAFFTPSDTLATVSHDSLNPYQFTAADSGQAIFDLSDFRFFAAGPQMLQIAGNGVTGSVSISVTAAEPSTFSLAAPVSVVAGGGFTIRALNVADRFGNPASGTVALFLNVADSLSPAGFPPSLPTLAASGGTGEVSASLYRAGRYPVFGSIGDSVRVSDSVAVAPAATDSFAWLISSPQLVGVPFKPTARLRAVDRFANTVTNFSVTGATVLLTSSTSGSLTPNALLPAQFSAGTADLAAIGAVYSGRGGLVSFEARSGGASGTSSPTEMRALSVSQLRVDQAEVRRGVDAITGYVTLRVEGTGSCVVTDLELVTSQGSFPLLPVQPSLPDTIAGPASRDYLIAWNVPQTTPLGELSLGIRALGRFATDAVAADLDSLRTVQVVSGAQLYFDALTPDDVAYAEVAYLITLGNAGQVGVSLSLDSTYLLVSDGGVVDTVLPSAVGQVFIPEAGAADVAFRGEHTDPFVGDSASITLITRGVELGQPFRDSVTDGDYLHFFPAIEITYADGSLAPDTVASSRTDTLQITLDNAGDLTLASVGTFPILLGLRGVSDSVSLPLASSITPIGDLSPGPQALAFVLDAVVSRRLGGPYAAGITFTGLQNRLPVEFHIELADSLFIGATPRVRIDSVWIIAPNRPSISMRQSFLVYARVGNTGDDVIDSLRLQLTTDGQSVFSPLIDGPSLAPTDTVTLRWDVRAESDSGRLETFVARVERAWGRHTLTGADVDPPGSDRITVKIQSPADLSVEARIYAPAEALDGSVAAGSQFQVAGRFTNAGEATTSGARLGLVLSGGFALVGLDTVLDVSEGVDAVWTLTAPSVDTSALIQVEFRGYPQELNTADTAYVAKERDSIRVTAGFEAPPLRVFDVATSGGVATGSYAALAFTWSNDDVTGRFPMLVQHLDVELLSADGSTRRELRGLLTAANLRIGGQVFTGDLSGEVIRFGGDSLVRVPAGDTTRVQLELVPVTASSLAEFRVSTRDALWSVVERSVGGAGLFVPVVDERGRRLDIVSELAFIPGETAVNYPNPFRAGVELTTIQYTLSAAADVAIRIFTTGGREVWRHAVSAGAAGGAQGVNSVTWDGRNGDGHLVVDGVYIARIESGGADETIKIVVMK